MYSKKVLLLSTYPIKNPQHGGQKRTHAIYEAYRQNFSAVRSSAVFFKNFYAHHGQYDIPLGPEGERRAMQSPLTGDIVCGEAIHNDPIVKKQMVALLADFKPDIIHVEQPFPFLGLQPLLQELNSSPKIVFGSQNIEAPMKKEILEGADASNEATVEAVKLIDKLERTLSKQCDLVIACTKADLKAHKDMGATNLVLAQNGIAPSTSTPRAAAYWEKKFNEMAVDHIALFVGSAHPPNWAGFLSMVGKGLGFVPYNSRIVAAGSISDYFDREITENNLNIEDVTFWLRAYSAGRLSEAKLCALIMKADVILLPITEGGGSNLKTAEAILADKKVVTTSHALRSFEWFRDFPNVWVADTKVAFQNSIVEALRTPHKARTKQQQQKARQVEWNNCLKDMVESVGKL